MSEKPDLNLSSILSLFPGRVTIPLSLHTTHTGVSSGRHTSQSLKQDMKVGYESRKTAASERQRSRRQRNLYISEKILVFMDCVHHPLQGKIVLQIHWSTETKI